MKPSLTYPPKGLRADQASEYLGLGKSKFLQMVGDGRMPKPRHADGCRIWDRVRLDTAFDELPINGEDVENEWDVIDAEA